MALLKKPGFTKTSNSQGYFLQLGSRYSRSKNRVTNELAFTVIDKEMSPPERKQEGAETSWGSHATDLEGYSLHATLSKQKSWIWY